MTTGLSAFDGRTQVWLDRQQKAEALGVVECPECPRQMRGTIETVYAELHTTCVRTRINGALPCPCVYHTDPGQTA